MSNESEEPTTEAKPSLLYLIQQELHAPKGQTNQYGGYKYRSCESILAALKPVLARHFCTINLTDSLEEMNGRYYLKATVTLTDAAGKIFALADAYAREEQTKKGMDAAQITGSASSYARKYALNGLLAIDDTADPDTRDNRENEPEAADVNLAPDPITDLAKLIDEEKEHHANLFLAAKGWLNDKETYRDLKPERAAYVIENWGKFWRGCQEFHGIKTVKNKEK